MSDAHFDEHQFVKPHGLAAQQAAMKFRRGGNPRDLNGPGVSINRPLGLDFSDLTGMSVQTVKVRRHYNDAWATDMKKVTRFLFRAFPSLRGRHPERAGSFYTASRWMEVIRLYFAAGYDSKSVALDLGVTKKAVEDIVYRIRLARIGRSAHGERRRRVSQEAYREG